MVVNAMGVTKRVATLYRVSTKKQLDLRALENGGDIPTQQVASKAFINQKPGWVLVHEYFERGVSGFKKRAENRDVIQEAKEDALLGKFDILLVFMFDRLGRIDDETPFVLQWFVEQGIEMWSVTEGQQKLDGHIDKLMNYIRFWQASGESIKTSIRVNETHSQMVVDGKYRGGTVPFGYHTEKSGKFNKKGKELLGVLIDPSKAAIVSWMYDLVDQEGYGQYRIAQLLNKAGIRTNTGTTWSSSSVNVVLRNPWYKGVLVYARGTEKEVKSEKVIPELIIVDEEKWERVQAIRERRSPENTKNSNVMNVVRSTKGSLLLIGMIRCGHCGFPLTTTWNKKPYIMKDGTKKEFRSAKYRCSGKGQQKVQCDGQTIHSHRRIEGVVLDEVYRYLDQLGAVDLTKEIEALKNQNSGAEEKKLKKAQKKLANAEFGLSEMMKEVVKVVTNTSTSFNRETLSEAIELTKSEITTLCSEIADLQQVVDSKKVESAEMELLQQYIPVWREVFEAASTEKQKMMLGTLIENVEVHRDRIEITFKLHISQFVSTLGAAAGTLKVGQHGKVLTHNALASNA